MSKVVFKKGGKLIEDGKVYRVIKLETTKTNGLTERVIHYTLLYQDKDINIYTCSIPEKSITEAIIREPVSKKEIKEMLKTLSKKVKTEKPLNVLDAKATFGLNDIFKTAEIFTYFWKDRKGSGDDYPKSKQDVLATAMNKMVEEVAYVIGVSREEARKRITTSVDN